MFAPLQSAARSYALALTLVLGTAPVLAADSTSRPGQPADPIAESFARMLNHEPSRMTPALPADAGTDPLIAAVVWPLLRSNQITVAGQAKHAPL